MRNELSNDCPTPRSIFDPDCFPVVVSPPNVGPFPDARDIDFPDAMSRPDGMIRLDSLRWQPPAGSETFVPFQSLPPRLLPG